MEAMIIDGKVVGYRDGPTEHWYRKPAERFETAEIPDRLTSRLKNRDDRLQAYHLSIKNGKFVEPKKMPRKAIELKIT